MQRSEAILEKKKTKNKRAINFAVLFKIKSTVGFLNLYFHRPVPVNWVSRLCLAVLWPCGDGRNVLPHAVGSGGPVWCHQSRRCIVEAVWHSPCGPPVPPCGLERGHSGKHHKSFTKQEVPFRENKYLEQEASPESAPQIHFCECTSASNLFLVNPYSAHIKRWIKSVTLVFAWMGAPWSSRISIILTWPFLAAQCRGVSSSWRKRIFSDSLDGASNYTFRKRARLLHLGLGINLSSSVQQEPNHDHIPPPGCNVQRSDTVLHRKTDALTQAHTSGAICGDGDCSNVGYFLPLG